MNLQNKHIVISGASSGIGRETVRMAADSGAQILLIGRNISRLEDVKKSITNTSKHTIIPLDLTMLLKEKSALIEYFNNNAPIDGVVNAAGITATHPFKYSSPAHYQELFETNVLSALELSRICVKYAAKESMSIVFLTSVMANLGERAKSAYSMSKGALKSAARSLALELAPKKIRVNCVSPGVVNTPMTENATYRRSEEAYKKILAKHPLGLGEPEDVASAILFLLSDGARWMTGSELVIDGGYSAL